MDYYFIREKIFIKDIQTKYISISAQFSDIFTKGLSSSRFLSLRDKLMVYYLPISLKEAVIDKFLVYYLPISLKEAVIDKFSASSISNI